MSAQHHDLIISGGTLVNHDGIGHGDVAVTNGRISALGDLAGHSAVETIDARGLHVLPGIIDSQVHFREPGLEWKEDLKTGADAAVLGGVCTVFEMPNTEPPTTTVAMLEDKIARATGRMSCDFAFYAGGTHDNVDELVKMEKMVGCAGVKVFMGASTGSLLVADDEGVARIIKAISRRAAFHSEDEFRLAERRSLARPGDWTSHHEVRDVEAAVSSTTRLLRIARAAGKRIHVLHISTAEEMEILKNNKHVASVEVLPNHLTLAAPDCYERLQGKAQQNPPIREQRHQDGLWAALRAGIVDVIGSDHAPHTLEEKARPYPASPSGTPGVQTMVPVMLTHVANGKLSLERLVDLLCHGPQRVFGLADKGRMAVGWHGDITLVDLKARRTITDDWIVSKSGWTPFDGMEAKGWPVATIVRGRVVMRDDVIVAPGLGEPVRFLEALPEG
ncbi:MAG: dihydroorotase [Hyphomonadaceae bacterium]|jgi:dihydroorotase|nr:dihydroorotase [Hyphomonadaceae bacterium]